MTNAVAFDNEKYIETFKKTPPFQADRIFFDPAASWDLAIEG